jgi:Transposase domain (DUF772)
MERFAMRPKERRDSGQSDLFRARLDQIADMSHPPARLAATIDWGVLEEQFRAVYPDKPGQPPLPTRLMAGLSILKHMHDLSDEELCARWVENPYYQFFCGEEFFRHKPPSDRSSLTRWRRMGEEKLVALIREILSAATRTGAAKPSDFSKVIVDTTVQQKAVAFPTDAKLMHRVRERLVRLAQKHGVLLRQSYGGDHARPSEGGQFIAHVKTLPGNPYDGHTLETMIPEIEAPIGASLSRIVPDRAYRGHNAPPDHRFKVYISGQKRGVTDAVKRDLRRRSDVEPVIGHAKSEHRMGRNFLKRTHGDAANAALAAAGYNFRRLLAWLAALWRAFIIALLAAATDAEIAPHGYP